MRVGAQLSESAMRTRALRHFRGAPGVCARLRWHRRPRAHAPHAFKIERGPLGVVAVAGEDGAEQVSALALALARTVVHVHVRRLLAAQHRLLLLLLLPAASACC